MSVAMWCCLQDQSVGPTITRRVIKLSARSSDHILSVLTAPYSYYEYIWQRTKGLSFGSLFNGMPQSLQADISLSLYKTIIDQVRCSIARELWFTWNTCILLSLLQVPLFQNTEIGFTKLLALSIKPVLYLSKEYIVRKGDHGSEV